MEKGFLSPKGRGRGNGVKEKQGNGADVPAKGNNHVDEATTSKVPTHSVSNKLETNMANPLVKEGIRLGINSTPNDVNSATNGNPPPPISFATLVKGNQSRKSVNFRPLFTPAGNGVDVYLSKKSVSAVNDRYNNTVYGFFLGKRVAYPVVENYVKNTWSKFGLIKSMMIKDMFFFKFGSKNGMEAMLETGPWFIRNVPLILNQWTPDANIMKVDVSNIPVWVKLHDVPITAFTEDGLSAIATKLGNPLMLDSYTAAMCTDSWGRASYARAMVELRADAELRDTIVVAVPKLSGEGFTTTTIHVEYEWTPLRCSSCQVFGHVFDECPKKKDSDVVNNLKKPRQAGCQAVRGIPVGSKPKSYSFYRPVQSTKKKDKAPSQPKVSKVTTTNPFDVLDTLVDEGESEASNPKSTNETITLVDAEEEAGKQTPSTNVFPVVDRINDLERQILEGKLVLTDEHGRPLEKKVMNDASASKPNTSVGDQFEESDDDEVELPDDETSRYMSSTGGGGFLEDDIDCFDGYEDQVFDLPKQMQDFCDQFDINLRGCARK